MSVRQIRRRLGAALAAGRAAARGAGGAPAPAQRPVTGQPTIADSWALVHLGPDAAFPAALDALLSRCADRRLRPLVVSDRFPRQLLGRSAIAFEHLPLEVAPACGTGDRELVMDYAHRRLALALGFWRVVGVTWSGDAAEALRDAAAARRALGDVDLAR